MKWFAVIVWLLVALAVGPGVQAEQPIYLPPGSVDANALIGPPPALGSAAQHEQMAIVLWLQQTRTAEQVARAQNEELDLRRFAGLLAEDLVGVDGVELQRTLESAIDDVRADYDRLKGMFNQPRPFQVDGSVHPLTEPRPVAAYPSGHATRAIVYARLLAEIFPDRAEALMQLGRQIGYDRVIAGVHYPVDIVAGQKLGNAYADVIVKQPAFQAAIVRIRGRRQPSQAD